MLLSDVLGIISIFISILGLCISCFCFNKIYKIKANNCNINQADNLNQSHIINNAGTLIVENGIDKYAVIKIAKDTTQEELKEIVYNLSATKLDLQELKNQVNSMPKIHVGSNTPTNLKNGDIFFQYK